MLDIPVPDRLHVLSTLAQLLIAACLTLGNPMSASCDNVADHQETKETVAGKDDTAGNQETAKADRGDPAITKLLQGLIDKHKIPGGMVAAIVDRGQVSAIGAAGVRKIGSPAQLSIHDKMHIGSCTKAMTATMIATLIEEELLRWDSTLSQVFPDLEMNDAFRTVTLKQLLSHRAGLPRNAPGMLATNLLSAFVTDERTDTEKRREIVAKVLKQPPAGEPGSEYSYSNVGYVVAGYIAEKVTGTSWQDLMRRRLFAPLGTTSVGFGPPGNKGELDQPWGHLKVPVVGWTALQEDNPSWMGPAGTVHCTLGDWAKFAVLHLGQTDVAGKRLLQKETLEALHHPADGGEYALGWFVAERDWAKGKALMHAGSNTMWFAIIWLAPNRETAFLAATNYGSGFDACDEAIGGLIAMHTNGSETP